MGELYIQDARRGRLVGDCNRVFLVEFGILGIRDLVNEVRVQDDSVGVFYRLRSGITRRLHCSRPFHPSSVGLSLIQRSFGIWRLGMLCKARFDHCWTESGLI